MPKSTVHIHPSFSVDEYSTLRNEIIQRISIMNNQAANAFGIILTVWAAGFSCLGILMANKATLDYYSLAWLSFCQLGAFVISLFIILPMAIKSGENISQIISIGIYIRIFYFYVPHHHDPTGDIFGWEYANPLINKSTTPKQLRPIEGIINNRLNSEYTILGVASLLFIFGSILINYSIVRQSSYIGLILAGYAVILLLSIAYIGIISLQSNIKRNAKRAAGLYVKQYLTLAVEEGFLKKQDLKKAWKELHPGAAVPYKKYESYFQ